MFEKADEIVAAARACIGTPFRHQGRLPGIGLDCAGLGIVAAQAVGIAIKDFSGYPREPFDGMLKKMFDEQENLQQISVNEFEAGDVLVMRFSADPHHVAVYVGGGYIVHAYRAIGKVAEHRLDDLWRKRIIYAYRFVL